MLFKAKVLPVIAAALMFSGASSWAENHKTYQVTGPVLELTDKVIVVQKGEERWEIARDGNTKISAGDVKVGDKVTVEYRMTATSIEAKQKSGKEGKKK